MGIVGIGAATTTTRRPHGQMLTSLFALALAVTTGAVDSTAQVTLRVDASEAVAALRILDEIAAHRTPSDADWRALHESAGYRRLQRREAAMKRAFTDDEFDAFLRADSVVARRAALRRTLVAWQRRNANAAARSALDWLPAGARINATIYLLIKPRTNSFVFETGTDPAIMLYLNPERSAAQYVNTITHELHHIGYASACAEPAASDTSAAAQVRRWLGAFGEGEAMLAAAGGITVHPHATSPDSDRVRWDRDVARFNEDVAQVQGFMRDVLDGRLTGDAIGEHASEFFGIQGPWYTVGWKMSTVIVRELGKPALLGAMCQPVELLTTYNRAASRLRARTGERLATWDEALLARARGAGRS